MPLVETISQDQAAPSAQGGAEGRFIGDTLGAGVDHPVADRGIFSPGGDQSPSQPDRFTPLVVRPCAYGQDRLGRRDVIAGMEINLNSIPGASNLTVSQILYSESCGRFIITLPPEKKEKFEEIFPGTKMAKIGTMSELPRFFVKVGSGKTVIEENVSKLKNSWKKRFGELV